MRICRFCQRDCGGRAARWKKQFSRSVGCQFHSAGPSGVGFDLRNPEFAVLVEAGCICFTEVNVLRMENPPERRFRTDHIRPFIHPFRFVHSGNRPADFSAGPQQLLLVPSGSTAAFFRSLPAVTSTSARKSPQLSNGQRSFRVQFPGGGPINFTLRCCFKQPDSSGEVMYPVRLAELIHT